MRRRNPSRSPFPLVLVFWTERALEDIKKKISSLVGADILLHSPKIRHKLKLTLPELEILLRTPFLLFSFKSHRRVAAHNHCQQDSSKNSTGPPPMSTHAENHKWPFSFDLTDTLNVSDKTSLPPCNSFPIARWPGDQGIGHWPDHSEGKSLRGGHCWAMPAGLRPWGSTSFIEEWGGRSGPNVFNSRKNTFSKQLYFGN